MPFIPTFRHIQNHTQKCDFFSVKQPPMWKVSVQFENWQLRATKNPKFAHFLRSTTSQIKSLILLYFTFLFLATNSLATNLR